MGFFGVSAGVGLRERNTGSPQQHKGSNYPALYPQHFTAERASRECRRKTVRHDGGTRFRLAVDYSRSFRDIS